MPAWIITCILSLIDQCQFIVITTHTWNQPVLQKANTIIPPQALFHHIPQTHDLIYAMCNQQIQCHSQCSEICMNIGNDAQTHPARYTVGHPLTHRCYALSIRATNPYYPDYIAHRNHLPGHIMSR